MGDELRKKLIDKMSFLDKCKKMGGGTSMLSLPYSPENIEATILHATTISQDFVKNPSHFDAIRRQNSYQLAIGNFVILHRKTTQIHYICCIYSKTDSEILFSFCGIIDPENNVRIFQEKRETYVIGYKYIDHYGEMEFDQWDLYEHIDIYFTNVDYSSTFTMNTVIEENINYDDCAICHHNYSIGEIACKTCCGHLYHKSCITEWQKRNCTCPLCREKLSV